MKTKVSEPGEVYFRSLHKNGRGFFVFVFLVVSSSTEISAVVPVLSAAFVL